MHFIRYFFSVILLITSLGVVAQETEIELDPVTVTATLSPLSVSKTGRNIIIIKGDQINKLPVNSIDELIRYMPGVEVQSRGAMGTQSNITIRGGTFQQVLIILDGIRLNDPLTGHFNSYIPISPAEIDRIEILKGASSAVYGTEAVGGVVHIITKTFAAKKNKDGYKINAQVTAGDFGLFNSQVGGFFHKNKTTASIGLITNNAKGQQLRGTKGYFNLTTFSASVKQELTENMIVAYRFGYDDRSFGAQNYYTQFLSDTATESVISRWHHVKFQFSKSKHKFSFDAGYKEAADVYRFRKGVNPNVNNSSLLQAIAIHDYKLNNNTTITSGLQYIGRKIVSNDRGNHEVKVAGVFVVLNQKFGDNLQLNPALRTDWNERSGWELVPQINASYRMEQFLFRASAGRTTRDADFTERFNNYQRNPVPSGNRIGNPDLLSETSFSYELGTDYFLGKHVKVSTTWFERYHNKLIDYVRTPYADMPRQINLVPAGVYNLAKNIDKVNTTGVETDLQYQQSFAQNHSITAALGFVWMRSRSSDTIPSLYVSNHANELVNFYVNYRYRFLGIGMNGLLKAKNAQPLVPGLVPLSTQYFLLNMRVDAILLKEKLGLFIQADNVFNKTYSDILGSVMPSRWVMGGIKLNL
jgi:vitamin B12 transporter